MKKKKKRFYKVVSYLKFKNNSFKMNQISNYMIYRFHVQSGFFLLALVKYILDLTT